MVGGGFEPPKASPTDLQSVPFDHSGTPPGYNAYADWGTQIADAESPDPREIRIPGQTRPEATIVQPLSIRGKRSGSFRKLVVAPRRVEIRKGTWSQRRDSNPRPTDYKSVALPAELRWPNNLTI